MAKKNLYIHSIDLKEISIANAEKGKFAQEIINIPYRGYEVERCADGRKIVITKPGGKSVFGHPNKEDIMVFIYDPSNASLWQITHQQILDDVTEKCNSSKQGGKKLIQLLERTFHGEEPNGFLDEINALSFSCGENPEELIKAYKWIWGQEDVNYPNGERRLMSWRAYEDLLNSLE